MSIQNSFDGPIGRVERVNVSTFEGNSMEMAEESWLLSQHTRAEAKSAQGFLGKGPLETRVGSRGSEWVPAKWEEMNGDSHIVSELYVVHGIIWPCRILLTVTPLDSAFASSLPKHTTHFHASIFLLLPCLFRAMLVSLLLDR